ncbi:MAG: FtsX-like permease family protein, partial [Gemmataceae bacterium]
MTKTRLLLENLRFHWRGNLAVLLGVAVGTAVLTGALLVADSLKGSLRALTLKQLGWVEDALISGRFVREKLASEIDAEHVAPVLLLQGSARAVPKAGSNGPARRAGNVVILGVNEAFWYKTQVPMEPLFWNRLRKATAALAGPNVALGALLLPEPENTNERVVLNKGLADDLRVNVGDQVALFVQKAAQVPRETLLGQREEVVDEVLLEVSDIVPDDSLGGSFNLNPRPGVPRNAFVPLHTLQEKLGVGPRVNALLVTGAKGNLNNALANHLTLDDWGLTVFDPEARTASLFDKLDRDHDGTLVSREWRRRMASAVVAQIDKDKNGELTRAEVLDYYRTAHPYLAVESKQMILEPAQARATLEAAKEGNLRAAPTMVYLANSIAAADNPETAIPYSVVAALDPMQKAPLGPFAPAGVDSLKDDEIVLVDWDESPLKPKPGDRIAIKYFLPEHSGKLQEKTETFTFKGFIPLEGVALDPDLTPEFPGITDKLGIADWDPPFPFDPRRVKKRDEDYWDKYRTTPKAFVTLKTGQRLWGSRFGDTTTIRLASTIGDLAKEKEAFQPKLLGKLSPSAGGLVFEPIRARALAASERGTDFSVLFLGFSFFLILAALLLVGLLFRLNLDRRSDEIGLLLATGFTRQSVRNLLLLEGGLLAALGAVVGSVAAIGYAWLVVELYAAIWPTTQGFNFLHLYA